MRARRPPGREALVAALLAGLALAAFAPVLRAAFLPGDDAEYVVENVHVLGGLTAPGVRWALTSFEAANWHPVTWLSHLLDVRLFGLDPRGHHATSLTLHLANGAVFFLLLRAMTGSLWRSAAAALLWSVHPLRVESVAWVAERKDVLSGLLGLLATAGWLRYARRPTAARYTLVLALLALGLAAKPMLVTLPLVLLLLDVWPLGRAGAPHAAVTAGGVGRLVAEKLPLLALAAAGSAVTLLAQGRGGAVESLPVLPLWARFANAAVSCAAYLGKTLRPVGLAVFYPHPGRAIPAAAVLFSLLALAALTAAALREARRRPALLVGWLWFAGALVPVSGLVQVGAQAMADRYTYLPSLGLAIAVAWGGADFAARGRRERAAALVLLALAVPALVFATRRRAADWRDGVTLFAHDLAVTGDNVPDLLNLGAALTAAGRAADAEELYRRALRLEPSNPGALDGLGAALAGRGRLDEAAACYEAALRRRPDDAGTHVNLGNLLLAEGRPEEAVARYREAVRLRPGMAVARYDLGFALRQAGRTEEAIAAFREATRLRPRYLEARNNLGVLLSESGRVPEALEEYRAALAIDPGNVDAHVNLGVDLIALGRAGEARPHLEAALARDPGNRLAREGLATLEARAGSAPARIDKRAGRR